MRILGMILALFLLPTPAAAQVVLSFYSHELGSSFPHAFVVLKGKTEEGRDVDTNFGFTAKTLTPAILMGSVRGVVETSKPSYVASSDRQFSVQLDDRQFKDVLAVVERWRTRPGKSYNLNKSNCIHFVGEVAQAVGLKVVFEKALIKKPRSFLLSLVTLNPWVKSQ
ncbi:MAG: hypothetical protein RIQ75_42 [Pseudomonadota bacterium]|jgi:hypothetical protein